ncbi:hypothetical protein DPMN_075533 [Dreissena polymorpha]|uniref:Uncharacterized protein n=1 Tax=Dreissena polymorpha TaxID=45954 RepID=A0A9D3YKN2_DREPO|nr:hypothetical protein DPMN_075533 [Dreissena polymorpha]
MYLVGSWNIQSLILHLQDERILYQHLEYWSKPILRHPKRCHQDHLRSIRPYFLY